MGKKPAYYFAQLDAIRGLSFLAVYFFHAFHPQFGQGFAGRMGQFFYNNLVLSIDIFFILSSFLLTWLGINEYKAKGNFSFFNYFIRRALRIWPLYFLLMLCAFVFLPFAAKALYWPLSLPPANYYIFFISNFYLEGHVYFLRFLWTISVEEQFYLVWGICLLFFQRQLIICMVVFSAVSIGYTVYAVSRVLHHDYNTLTYLFDFAAGILAAVVLHKGGRVVEFFISMKRFQSILFIGTLPVLFLFLFLLTDHAGKAKAAWLDLAGRYAFIIYTGFFILDQMVNERPVLKLKASRFLVYTGKISYGLYCFHGIVLTFGILLFQQMKLPVPVAVQAIVLLAANYLVAALSYRFIESPFLTMKNRLRRI